MKKIVIDAGHGGADSGAVANGLLEKNLTLEISNLMADKLRNLGVQVFQTRTFDETLTPQERIKRIMNAFGNSEDVIVISNHINAGGGDGAEVIYALRNTSDLSNLILDELSRSGQNIRKAYQRRLPSDISKDYYFIHRDTGITEPVIIEYGFIDSKKDDVNQLKNDTSSLVDAVVRALSTYINIPYISSNTYIVKPGDTLWGISKKYNVSIELLKKTNNLTNNVLSVGQPLTIPTDNNLSENKSYVVQKGDTLYKIASNNNVTVKELLDYNNLNTATLKEGQIILIPLVKQEVIEEEHITYTVQKGDTLYKIASKYNTTVENLKRINNLNTNILSIGQVIKIPTKDIEEVSSSSYIEYIVKPGDTLYKISKDNNVAIQDIISKNNLTSTILQVGQKIML